MKTIRVPASAKAVNDLFEKARSESLILESHDGRRFVLALVEGWEGFEVGDDITQNRELMKHLTERRGKGKAIALADAKTELGIE